MKKGLLILFLIIVLIIIGVYNLGETAKAPTGESKLASETVPVRQEEPEPVQETAVVSPAEVHFIDVGQGDCILIDVGQTEVLVDCGKAKYSSRLVEYLVNYVDGELEYLVATHPDEDHIGGIIGVLQCFEVGTVIDSGAVKDSNTYYNYVEEVKNQGIHLMEDEDTAFSLGEGNSLQIIETGDGNIDVNEDSVVCMFTCGGISVLLTGDMGIDTEEKNLTKFPKVDVLKAGHHGSAYSTGMDFLKRTKPDHVIISVGEDNEYGHPAEATLQRIATVGAQVYSTADKGTIILRTDGQKMDFDFTGSGLSAETEESGTASETTEAAETAASAVSAEQAGEPPYIGNANTKKFHYSWCSSVRDMAEHNKVPLYSRDEADDKHYEPCKRCDP